MKRFFGFIIALCLLGLLTVPIGIYVFWNPSDPAKIEKIVQTQASAHGGYVPLRAIPPFLVHALLATEDRNFYGNHGVDLLSIGRAFLVDTTQGSLAQGASTITEQLVKNTLLTDQKTVQRKLQQIAIAVMLSFVMKKNKILELYLNDVYFGQGAYGIGEASSIYFHRKTSQLTDAQAAMLVGLLQAPSAYDPITHYSLGKKRQSIVLKNMVVAHYISLAMAKKLFHEKIF